MTAPTQSPAVPEVIDQQQSVTRCLLALTRSFDVPCECGGPSSACTKDKDGNCG